MEIRCRCSKCEAKFKAEEASAGLKIPCPRCGGVVVVPPVATAIEDPTTTAIPRIAPQLASATQPSSARQASQAPSSPDVPVEAAPPSNPWPLWIGLAALGLVAVGVLLFVVYLVNRPVAHTAIVLHWPLGDRKGAMLDVSNKPIDIGARDPLMIYVDEGPHSVRLQRKGFEAVSWKFTLIKGEQKNLTPEWKPLQSPAPKEPPAKPGKR